MGVFEFVISLVSIILGCVTLWIIMFYARKEKSARYTEPSSRYSLEQLSTMADSLQDRIDTLEAILDAEVPDWREQNERPSGSTSN